MEITNTVFPTLEEAIETMYNNPPYSSEFMNATSDIMEKLAKGNDKYKEDLFCIPSIFNQYDQKTKADSINYAAPISEITIEPGARNNDSISLFTTNPSILACGFDYRKRYEVEHNPLFRQLSVGVLYVIGDHVMLLSTNKDSDTRIKNKTTLVQGHVTYDKDNYIETPIETLIKNAERELREEVILDEQFYSIKDKIIRAYLINDMSNHTALEHFGVVFVVDATTSMLGELSDGRHDMFDFKSGFKVQTKEPTKHTAELYNIGMLTANGYLTVEMDSWLKLVVDKFVSSI